jgi:hypothetical protein
MAQIRKILGGAVIEHVSHSVAKLENGHYAVGQLAVGQSVETGVQFETLDAAFDHWLATLPMHTEPAQRECEMRGIRRSDMDLAR